jgi:UDP-GlcNAc:undecaprenyl-phosphate/decaprenyl-phosphate GlcNAc-1-phosphate transferase
VRAPSSLVPDELAVIALLSFLVATATAVIAGAAVRRLAPVYGAVVPPRPDRWHSAPTPTMGGIAIAIATVTGFSVALAGPLFEAEIIGWSAVLLAGLAMFTVGLFDDRLQLSPVAKLVASLAVGAFLVFALSGIEPDGALPSSYTLIGTIWFAGVCHAFNLLDNMDGLAAGVALIATAFLAWLVGPSLGVGLFILLIALVGALTGFLHWNRPRARLFMGDCGSLFIGAILGGIALVPVFHARITFVSPSVLTVLILVVPLFDTAFVLVLRRLAGRSATRGGTDHVSHRLVSLGFSERSAIRILYTLGLMGGVTAWILVRWNTIEPMLIVALFGVLVILTGIYLARVPAYNAEDFKALQKSSFAPFLKDLAFRWHVGEVLLDLVLITVCYYVAFRIRFDGDELLAFLPYFTASLPLVLGVKLAALYTSGLYRRSWETFGFRDLAAVARGVGMGSLLTVAVAYYLYRGEGSSRVVLVLDGLLLALAIFATRASFRTMNLVASARNRRNRRVLVYGAGGYGRLLVREMRANPAWKMNPVGFIDDDPMKAHRWIGGVPVRGSIEELEKTMHRYSVDEIVLSSPAINGKVEHRIKEVCARLRRPVRRLDMKIT